MERNKEKFTPANKDAIEYKLAQEIERFSTASNKIPNYIAVVVFLIPLYYALFVLYSNNSLSLMFSSVAAYYLLGCAVIVSQTLTVKGFARADMKTLLENQEKAKYFDWQIRKRENDFYVGLIKNIEGKLLLSVVLAIAAGSVGLIVSTTSQPPKPSEQIVRDSSTQAIQFKSQKDTNSLPDKALPALDSSIDSSTSNMSDSAHCYAKQKATGQKLVDDKPIRKVP